MSLLKHISVFVSVALLSGCVSGSGAGAHGPRLVASGRTTPAGAYYAEVGVEFSTYADYVALFTPNRWKEPIQTGGSLSWLNPNAWSDDAGRTGRILLGEAVVVGGAVAVAVAVSADDGDSGPTEPGDPPDLPDTPID